MTINCTFFQFVEFFLVGVSRMGFLLLVFLWGL